MSEICVVGLGYVGLPAAVMLALGGHRVHGTDVNPDRVEAVRRVDVGSEEDGLNRNLENAINSGSLTVSTTPAPADVFIIAVPTPISEDKSPDLSYVVSACRSIRDHVRTGNLVVVESTIPPGATANTIAPVLQESGLKVGRDLGLAYCPERVLPGNIMRELVENDRIIGGVDARSTRLAVDVYRTFVSGALHETDAATAEMVKLAENTYRDVNIALANSLANISETVGVNVWDVIDMANRHPRVDLLKPGAGVGGHCIPVDPWFLVTADGASSEIVSAARRTNDLQPGVIADMALRACRELDNPRIALLGAAYKPNVSDARESPTTYLADRLAQSGAIVTVTDPFVTRFQPSIQDFDHALQSADLAVLVVAHDEYRALRPDSVAALVGRKVFLDTTNLLDGEEWKQAGFEFFTYGAGLLDGGVIDEEIG